MMRARLTPNPRVVLALALILPGSGQVLNRQPVRGLTFVFFIVLLASYTMMTAMPNASIIGKLSGGVFVQALAIFDAYKRARIRAELLRQTVQLSLSSDTS